MTEEVVVALTTLESEADAAALVRELVQRRLIACGTILPGARSIYRWNENVVDNREVVVLLKTTEARLEALEASFTSLHPYEVPELLVLRVRSGLEAYLAWVRAESA